MSVKLLDFYADWCGPCKKQDPILEEVEEEWEDNDVIEFEKVDIDENSELAQNFSVRSIPTIIIIEENDDGEFGELYERFVGIANEDEINEALRTAVEEYN